jgi:hypothetical protein
MQHPPQARAMRAYGATQSSRSLREQEAEVYSKLAGRLRAAMQGTPIDVLRARADAQRLFTTLRTLVLHESSPLPMELRRLIASVAKAALADLDTETPDLGFLADICEDFAAGLNAKPGAPVNAAIPVAPPAMVGVAANMTVLIP